MAGPKTPPPAAKSSGNAAGKPAAPQANAPPAAAGPSRAGAIQVGPPVVTGLHLLHAVEEAIVAHDAQRLQALQVGLRTSAPDEDRRAVAYGFLRLAVESSSAGRFAEAHDRVRAAGVARGKSDPVVAVVSGNVSMLEARRLSGDAREQVFEQAAAAYASACRDDPNRADALHGWGSALAAVARSQKGVKAERTLALAAEKLQAAVAADGTRVEAVVQWAHAFAARGEARLAKSRGRPGPDLDLGCSLLDEACARYADADRLAPKRLDIAFSWGRTLSTRAHTQAGAAAAALLDDAVTRYKAAAKLAKGVTRAGVLRCCGHALAARARVGDPGEADRLRSRAVEKFDEAIDVPEDVLPDRFSAAEIQLERAAAKTGARRAALADDARTRLVKAVKARESDDAGDRGRPGGEVHELLFALARAHALAGDAAKCVGALERWAESAEKATRKSLDTCPDFDPVREDEAFVAFRRSR
ncbi:MAG: hypothetical protein K8T90_04145 [Planctomycetes bacterium]|nr:hypothetical protein [Planctomycetota bacterium]